jgi:hypothetical protein
MAKYNREFCEDYFRKIRQLGDESFVRMWMHMAKLAQVPSGNMDAWLVEWDNMSPWNQQGVLFLIAPEIDRIARDRAMEASRRARVEDPL